MRFGVRVKPRSSRSELVAVRDGTLEVALRAAPVEGAANDELMRLLARALKVSKSALRIAVGNQARHKVIEVDGIDGAELQRRLAREMT